MLVTVIVLVMDVVVVVVVTVVLEKMRLFSSLAYAYRFALLAFGAVYTAIVKYFPAGIALYAKGMETVPDCSVSATVAVVKVVDLYFN